MRRITFVVLVFLAAAAVFNTVYAGLYVAFSVVLVAGVFMRRRFVDGSPDLKLRLRYEPRVFMVSRIRRARRLVKQASAEGEKVLPNRKVLMGFVALAVVALLFGVVIGASLVRYSISGSGRIQLPPALAVYADVACTLPVSELDWGTFAPGETVNRTIYLRNEGGVSGNYSLSTANWNPQVAEQFLGLNWDYAGQIVLPGSVVKVTLRLHASSSITSGSGVSSFRFDAVISLEG